MALGPNWTELKKKKVFKQYILGLEFPQIEHSYLLAKITHIHVKAMGSS